jgi:hypothetical protein
MQPFYQAGCSRRMAAGFRALKARARVGADNTYRSVGRFVCRRKRCRAWWLWGPWREMSSRQPVRFTDVAVQRRQWRGQRKRLFSDERRRGRRWNSAADGGRQFDSWRPNLGGWRKSGWAEQRRGIGWDSGLERRGIDRRRHHFGAGREREYFRWRWWWRPGFR